MEKPMQIENGIPLPPKRRLTAQYPFAKLAVGDSFLLACTTVERTRLAIRLRTAAEFYRKRTPGWNFTSRQVDGGVRLWRTE